MEVSRREILAGAIGGCLAANAGCTAFGGGSVDTPEISVESTTVPDELRSSFDFTVERLAGFSEDHPARIRASLTRREDDTSGSGSVLKFGATPPFSFWNGSQDDHGPLLLALPEDTSPLSAAGRPVGTDYQWIPDEPDDGCWRSPVLPQVPTQARTPIHLSPGESVSENYTLLGHGKKCLNDGTYRFVSHEPYHVSVDGHVAYSSAGRWSLEFTVRLG